MHTTMIKSAGTSLRRRFMSSGTAAQFKLAPHSRIQKKGPVLVAVLDGVGIGDNDEYNAVYLAKTPVLDKLMENKDRFRTVLAHGKAVGLPTDDDMGNSEVGHNALGCGRIVKQGASLVDAAIADGSIFQGEGWGHLQPSFAANTFHIIGLLSDGGVHSRMDQIIAIVKGAVRDGAKKIRMHVLLDGRDVPDGTAGHYIEELEAALSEARDQGVDAQIASGGGRMNVTMDRYEADWSIVERGWKAHVLGQGQTFSSAAEAVKQLSESNSDQYLDSFVVSDPNDTDQPLGAIEDGDAVLCANFRGDRVIEISRTFDEKEFDKFDRQRHPDVRYAGLMEYDGDLHIPKHYLVNPPLIERTAGEYLVNNNVSTYAVSETQKFGHVTYFWNGNKSGTFDDGLETYAEVESDRIQFNEAPAMKAKEISDLAVQALASGKYDCVRLNFANGDMVGHTGDLQASIEAMEVVDKYLGVVLEAVEEQEGSFVIVGDHGNADQMVQKKKGEALVDDQGNHLPLTSHTLAPVPFIVGGPGLPDKVTVRHDIENAGLANVTASYINMLGLESPVDYEESLLVFSEAQ